MCKIHAKINYCFNKLLLVFIWKNVNQRMMMKGGVSKKTHSTCWKLYWKSSLLLGLHHVVGNDQTNNGVCGLSNLEIANKKLQIDFISDWITYHGRAWRLLTLARPAVVEPLKYLDKPVNFSSAIVLVCCFYCSKEKKE